MTIKSIDPTWTFKELAEHIQYAIELELWTIPFYMSAMYSVVDRSSSGYQYIQSVANQEMLHLQCVCNIANAFGVTPQFFNPKYEGVAIPHLDFSLNQPDPRPEYSPYSAELGPLDEKRINAMCLVEYPNWLAGTNLGLLKNCKDYGNIGEFYIALRDGAEVFQDKINGGVKQVDYFSSFYRKMPNLTVTESGKDGFYQVGLLVDLITDQGEGIGPEVKMDEVYQNTADDLHQEITHFTKFRAIRNDKLPLVYKAKPPAQYTNNDKELLKILQGDFRELLRMLTALFNGQNPLDFVKYMISVGADMQNCWKHGVIPLINEY